MHRSSAPVFLKVLFEAVDALDKGAVPYVVGGGIAAKVYGRRVRLTKDADIFVKPDCADRTLDVLSAFGFATERLDPRWLYKAYKEDVLVDIIFESRGGIQIDDEMLRRATEVSMDGHNVRLLPPEDLLVMKALTASSTSDGPHWHDALAIVENCELDWQYLVQRASANYRRILSFTLFAQTEGLNVPEWVIRELARLAIEP